MDDKQRKRDGKIEEGSEARRIHIFLGDRSVRGREFFPTTLRTGCDTRSEGNMKILAKTLEMPLHLTRERERQLCHQWTSFLREWCAQKRKARRTATRPLLAEEIREVPVRDGLGELRRIRDIGPSDDEDAGSQASSPWSLASDEEGHYEEQIAFEDWFDKLNSCVETDEICPRFAAIMDLTRTRCPRCGILRAPTCARRRSEDICHGCAGHYVCMSEKGNNEETSWLPDPTQQERLQQRRLLRWKHDSKQRAEDEERQMRTNQSHVQPVSAPHTRPLRDNPAAPAPARMGRSHGAPRRCRRCGEEYFGNGKCATGADCAGGRRCRHCGLQYIGKGWCERGYHCNQPRTCRMCGKRYYGDGRCESGYKCHRNHYGVSARTKGGGSEGCREETMPSQSAREVWCGGARITLLIPRPQNDQLATYTQQHSQKEETEHGQQTPEDTRGQSSSPEPEMEAQEVTNAEVKTTTLQPIPWRSWRKEDEEPGSLYLKSTWTAKLAFGEWLGAVKDVYNLKAHHTWKQPKQLKTKEPPPDKRYKRRTVEENRLHGLAVAHLRKRRTRQ